MGYKIPLIQGDGYTFYIEPYSKQIFVHCDVQDNPTVGIIKEMLSKWKQFREVTCADFFAIHDDIKNKPTHKKFLTLFGFKFLESRKAINGETVEIWSNTVKVPKCQ